MLERVPPSHCTSLDPALFAGTWNVRRKIVDHRAGAVYAFEGQAILMGGAFEERGEMCIGESRLEAVRAYKLLFGATSVRILYPSGNEFIALEFQVSQKVHHLCGADTYAGRFFFRSADEWVEIWRVNGPQKRYASLTRYRRVVAG